MQTYIHKQNSSDLQQAQALRDKFRPTHEELEEALEFLKKATESCENDIDRCEAYLQYGSLQGKIGSKTRETYDDIVNMMVESTKFLTPGWFCPGKQLIPYVMCPELFGFDASFADEKFALTLQKKVCNTQIADDLTITAKDWVNFTDGVPAVNQESHEKLGKFGMNYLTKVSEKQLWSDVWKTVLFTCYGRTYMYHLKKTTENFNKAVDYFKQSINETPDVLGSNQPWKVIGQGKARAYIELAQLYSNPERFGFEVTNGDKKLGNSYLEEGLKYMEDDIGCVASFSILEQMFVNAFKERSLHSLRSEEDLPLISRIAEIGRKEGDRHAVLWLLEGLAYHAVGPKTVENYKKIVECYKNSFSTFKNYNNRLSKGLLEDAEFGGDHFFYFRLVQNAAPLALDGQAEDFPPEVANLKETNELVDLMKKVLENPKAYKCDDKSKLTIDLCLKLYSVKAAPGDKLHQARMAKAQEFILHLKTSGQQKEAEEEIEKQKQISLSIQDVFNDEQLYGYYDGFVFCFTQAYTTAVAISGGQLQLDTGPSTVVKLGLKAVEYIPFIGDKIADPLSALQEFITSANMKKDAGNVSRLAPDFDTLKLIVQETVITVINDKRVTLQNYKEEDEKHTNWFGRVKKFIEVIKVKIDQTLYGDPRCADAIGQLGFKHASDIISQGIYNGKIYGGKPRLIPQQAIKRIQEVFKEIELEEEEKLKKKEAKGKQSASQPSQDQKRKESAESDSSQTTNTDSVESNKRKKSKPGCFFGLFGKKVATE